MKTSNRVLLVMGLFALAFITTMIALFCVKNAVPDTLIQYTLGTGGLEALLLAGIKIAKVLGPSREPGGADPVAKEAARELSELYGHESEGI